MHKHINILRCDRGRGKLGNMSKTTWYGQIDSGLVPAGVAVGLRSVGWPEHELDAILAARLAGWTDDQIRKLVKGLMEERLSGAAVLDIYMQATDAAPAQ
jgi:prophage regulatory protein